MSIPFPFVIWLWPLAVLEGLSKRIEMWVKTERAEIQAATTQMILAATLDNRRAVR